MKRIALLLMLLPTMSFAQTGQPDCSSGNTQDINACAQWQLEGAQRELNQTYEKLLANLRSAEADWLRPQGALTKPLEASQQAWLGFVRANCAFYYEQINGTMAASVGLTCERRLTEQRSAELKNAFMGPP
jgi:uncharacterized protein YecT (DUF1311 family)